MSRLNRISRVALLAAAAVVVLLASTRPERRREGRLRVATMHLGTSWYVFGATLYELLRDELPPEVRLEVLAKGGGIGNPLLVDSGRAAMALSNVCSAVWARSGHEVYGGRKQENLRALVGGLNPVWVTAIVREEFIRESGEETLEAVLTGDTAPRIVMKPRGSTVPVVADMILAALGTSREDVIARGGRVLQVSAQEIPAVIRDGRADLYFEAAPLGHPTVTEVSLTSEVRFLDIPERVLAELSRLGLEPAEIPRHFRGQNGPTRAVDLGTLLICRDDLPDEVAYIVTRTICERSDLLARAHRAWARFRPERAGWPESTGIPLHVGARRYFVERGWLEGEDGGGR